MRRSPVSLIPVFATLFAVACGGKGESPAPAAGSTAAAPASAELTPFEVENGIGPVTQVVELGPLDQAKVAAGKTQFEGKCQACHKFDERYVGPALGGVTKKRTPAYIMNMILNPEGMTAKHPAARQLLADHMTQMPNLGLTQDQAREVVEFLRTHESDHTGS